jgi:VWFA-related protein
MVLTLAALRARVAVAVAMGFGAALAASQAPPARPAQPVFRASTSYVSLDVVVTDSRDRLVTDLRREEFVVVEKGRPQRVEDFLFVSIPAFHRPIDLGATPPPPSDVIANTVTPNASRALAIVVDDGRLPPEHVATVKRTLKSMIEVLAPDDQVGFTYVSRSDLGRDFTSDHAQLVTSINNLKGALGQSPGPRRSSSASEGNIGGQSSVMLSGLSKPSLIIVLENVIATLSAARQSRKAIVLVGTAGCNPGDRNMGDFCKEIIKRANQAGVPIYGLNPLGLMDAMASAGVSAYETAEGRSALEAGINDERDTLKILAHQTGGLAFVQSNLQAAVRDVMSDNGNFYVLGYYPDPLPSDGKFHEVDVKVTRPGLRVRSRPGYMADGGKTRMLPIVAAMTKDLGAGLPDPSLALRGFVAPIAAGRDGTRTIVTAEVTYPSPDGGFSGAFNDEWRMGILALDADGKIKASFQRPLGFVGTWKPGAKGTFLLNEVVDLPTSTVTVRIGVTSRMLGRTGTVHVPIKVPNYTKKELQLTPLLLGDGAGAVPMVDAAIGLDRLRGLVPFQPSTERIFTSGQQLRVHTQASWRSKDDTLQAELQIDGLPHLPGGLDGPFKVMTDKKGQRHALLDCTLSLTGVPPGRYVLRVVARLAGGETVKREIPFTVR